MPDQGPTHDKGSVDSSAGSLPAGAPSIPVPVGTPPDVARPAGSASPSQRPGAPLPPSQLPGTAVATPATPAQSTASPNGGRLPTHLDPVLYECLKPAWTTPDCGSASRSRSFPGWPIPSSFLVAIGARRGGPWLFGFAVAIVTMVISLGDLATVAGQNAQVSAVLLGAGAGLLSVIVLALIALSANSACATYPDQVKELRERVREAQARLKGAEIKDDSDQTIAENVINLLCDVVKQLEIPGRGWLDGSGFLDCWTKIHEAEECLLLIEQESEVVGVATYDLLRLNGSQISGKDGLIAELKAAVPFLSASAAAQINTVPQQPPNPDVARRRIRTVRMAIDEDREQQWDQVVRSRNGLITAGVVTLGVGYLLVLLGIGLSAAPKAMEAALVLALIAVIVSASYQLLVRSNAQNDVEDFGFATVKLVVVPILAGVAALLAIVLVAEFQLVVGGQALGGTFNSWQATFDWRKNVGSVALAILVGFAPSLFFQIVQSKVDLALSSLKSSQPSGAAPSK
jgi:hypothetical protein